MLLFLIGFNSTCNVVIIAIDIYGVWAFFRRKKEDDLAWEERQANEEKERRATECYQKAEEHPEDCYCMGALMEKNHPEVACKYYEIAANRQYIPAMLKLALLYEKEDTL